MFSRDAEVGTDALPGTEARPTIENPESARYTPERRDAAG
jgi:hypothetical protein